MVDNQLDMIATTQPQSTAQPERMQLLRWFRHFVYMPWRTRHYFNQESQVQINQAVKQAEQGHAGEIQVIIEGHLPLNLALQGGTATRAKQLFAQYGVWDTAHNSGVLLYINICEHRVEILADRGIHQFVDQGHWQNICEQITTLLKQEKYVDGVLIGIELIGNTLIEFYDKTIMNVGNELTDSAVFL